MQFEKWTVIIFVQCIFHVVGLPGLVARSDTRSCIGIQTVTGSILPSSKLLFRGDWSLI